MQKRGPEVEDAEVSADGGNNARTIRANGDQRGSHTLTLDVRVQGSTLAVLRHGVVPLHSRRCKLTTLNPKMGLKTAMDNTISSGTKEFLSLSATTPTTTQRENPQTLILLGTCPG